MFEYWIFDSVDEEKIEDNTVLNKECIWYFQSKNVFVIQSFVPFGDGNLALDEMLVKLADHYEIHDKGIIKSHWQASSSQ